jgi:hypothetical protein
MGAAMQANRTMEDYGDMDNEDDLYEDPEPLDPNAIEGPTGEIFPSL